MPPIVEWTIASRSGSPAALASASDRSGSASLGWVVQTISARARRASVLRRSGWDLGQQRPQDRSCRIGIPGPVACRGGGDAQHGTPVPVRHESGGSLQQVGRDARCAAPQGHLRRRLQLVGDRRSDAVDGRRAMDRPLERVVGGVGERRSQRATLSGRRVRVARRGEQWMRGTEARAVLDEDPGGAGFVDRRAGRVAEDAAEEGDRRLGRHGHEHEGAPGRRTQRREVIPDQRSRFGRHREGFARGRLHASGDQGTAHLEGHERVAGARVVDPDEQRPRMGDPEALLDEPADGPDRQRSDGDPPETLGRHRGHDLGRWRHGLDGPAGQHEGDRFRAQAPGSEGQRPGGRRIAPLDVVEPDHDRPFGRQRPDQVEQGEADEARVGWPALQVPAPEGQLERLPAGRTERQDGRVANAVEQAHERPERELSLGGARSPGDGALAPGAGDLQGEGPQGRLADAGLALDEEGGGARCGQGTLDGRPLIVPPDDRRRVAVHARSPRRDDSQP